MMYCSNCGIRSPDDASFCKHCRGPLGTGEDQPRDAELASLGQRFWSFVIDGVLAFIPFVNIIFTFVNLGMFRRGNSIGLNIVGARIIRENGDLSGFFQTSVRSMAAVLSIIPFGLGYLWAIWDPKRQTWHDKLLHTSVVRGTEELANRRGSSSRAAVFGFWLLMPLVVLLIIWADS